MTLLVRMLSVGHRRHIAFLLAGVCLSVFGGAGLFAYTQGLPYTTGIYWAFVTATTVGYGDVTPKNAAGRVVASAVMLTTIPMLAAVFALVTGGAIVAGVRRLMDIRSHFPEGVYRLVVGMNPAVPAILDELMAAGDSVVLVADVDPGSVRDGVHVIRGDPTELAAIRAGRPEGAQQALITGGSDGDVLVSAVVLRKLAPDLEISALVSSAAVREALHDLGVQLALSTEALIAHTLAKTLEAPHAGDMVTDLVESNAHRLAEVEAEAGTVGKLLSAVRDERDGLVLGLVHDGKFTLGIGDDPVVAVGDHLLIAESRKPHRPAAKVR
jgi:voltage-gated potassium channel